MTITLGKKVAYKADYVWQRGAFHSDLFVIVVDGKIESISETAEGASIVPWPGKALLPGFVNAHSHAFQRLIRGRVQGVPQGKPGADFWSWRKGMYQGAAALTPASMAVVCRFVYLEMLLAGFTSVCEFHYVHHQNGGRPYSERGILGRGVLSAATDVGIRNRLLAVAYGRGGPGRPLEGPQKRFGHSSVAGFLETLSAYSEEATALSKKDDRGLLSVGAAIHSVRAVAPAWMRPIAEAAQSRSMPLHAHVSEQPKEIEICLAENGLPPVAFLDREGCLSPQTTLVHAVHLQGEEVRMIADSGATVCACPTTERDLGDGILPAARLAAAGVPLAIGTDSHAQVDPFAELQALEGHERLSSLKRCRLLGEADENGQEVGPALIDTATLGGRGPMGMNVGALEPGAPADFVGIDLSHVALLGATPRHLASMIALAGRPSAVTEVVVAGEWLVKGGIHPLSGQICRDYLELVNAVYS